MEYQLVSVIVPVYNREKEIDRCVTSVLNQTYPNLELILVDDGSADSSLAICKSYSDSDKRVRVFHQENSGVSSARNLGIQNAKGEYLTFVDSDDYIAPDYVEKLYLVLVNNSCNVSMCNYSVVNEKNEEKKITMCDDGVMSSKELMEDVLYGRDEAAFCWGKMWKKDFITKLFRKYAYCEDTLFFAENLSSKIERIATVKKSLYFYVKHENSVTGKRKAKDLEDTLDVAYRIVKLSHDSPVIDIRATYALALNYAFFAYLSVKEDDPGKKKLQRRCLHWIKRLRGFVFRDFHSTVKTKGASVLSFLSMNLMKKIYSKL